MKTIKRLLLVTFWKVIIRIIVTRNDAEGDIKLKGVKVVLGETIA
jgi:hypothetical protein